MIRASALDSSAVAASAEIVTGDGLVAAGARADAAAIGLFTAGVFVWAQGALTDSGC